MTAIKRYHLRKDKVKELKNLLRGRLQPLAEKLAGSVEILDSGDCKVVISNEKPVFILGEKLVPALTVVGEIDLPTVVVDMGAVGPLCRGADVMAPGVTRADEEIWIGDLVVIVDERHGRPLAVGEALVFGNQIKGEKGRVVKNLHHVGDDFWEMFSSLLGTKVK